MYLAIILIPLLAALASGILGRKLGVTGTHLVSCTALILSAFMSLVLFFEVGLAGSEVTVSVCPWLESEFLSLSWTFLFDSLTVSMLLPILIISALVQCYSVGYMGADPHHQRFFAYLSMFTFFMLLLTCGDNLLILFIGWEGVGVASYLLISFWFTRIQATKSALQAIVVNRIGDWLFSIGLFAIFWGFGGLELSSVFSLVPYVHESIITIVGFCLLGAAMGKSSQLGLHVWLPNAMEGPTPVSALLHAATMVVAGVYLLLRLSPLLEYSETVLVLVVWIGALTGFIAATIGLCQNDLKRVIAYSTTSQLGMMFLACGLSQYNVAIFHLVNHAFFKALLFLSAGAIIHAMYDEQDLRKFGGLRSLLPFTYVCIFVGSLSLMATPFLSGFYSKDLIILSAYGHYSVSGYVSYFLCVLTALFSALYSTRLLYLAFLNSPNGPKVNYSSVHEPSLTMALPMFILAVLSIFSGYLAKDFFMPGSVLSNTLFVHPNHIGGLDPEFSVPLLYKLLPLLVSLLGPGLLLALYIWSSRPTSLVAARNDLQRSIYILFNQAWHFPALYSKLTSIILDLGYITGQTIDKGVLELLGPLGISNNISKVSSRIAKLDSGFIPHYALYVVSGLTLMLYFSANIIDPKLFFLLVWVLVLLPDTRLGGGFSSPYVSASRPINSPPPFPYPAEGGSTKISPPPSGGVIPPSRGGGIMKT